MLEHKQVLVKRGSIYFMSYPETYQSSEDGKIKPKTSQKSPNESPKVPNFEDNDIDEDLETPNNNVDKLPN